MTTKSNLKKIIPMYCNALRFLQRSMRGMETTTMFQIDGAWFHDKLRKNKKSLRSMARHLNMDPAALSRTFSGVRKITAEEVTGIAEFLGAPVSEVFYHSGLSAPGFAIRLTAIIDAKGRVEPLAEAGELPTALTDRAHAAVGNLYEKPVTAAQIRAAEGPLAMWDDAIILFIQAGGVDPAAIGALSICTTREGTQIFARVVRLRKTGEADITEPTGQSETVLSSATPILAVLP